MTDIFQISKLIIKKNLIGLNKKEETQLEALNKSNPFVSDINFERLVDRTSEYNKLDKERAWESINNKAQRKTTKPVFKLFKRPVFKYAVAASVLVVLSLGYLFKVKITENHADVENKYVEEKIISPGTNKAILTLGDGSQIALEKGASFKTKHLKSNGEEVFYEKDKGTKKTVYNYITIPRGGQFFIKLSDGSRVWLNSETQLKYPVNFIDGETREVELVYGEAYFDISPSSEHHGSKFKVISKGQEVEVVGTAFNIKAYADEYNIYTTLVEGKVLVDLETGKQNLNPNQQLILDLKSKSTTLNVVDVYNEISWKDGVFSFEEKTLKEMMKVLSRWYDIDVVYKNKSIENKKVVGILRKNQEIEQILTAIMNFEVIKNYEIQGKKVILE